MFDEALDLCREAGIIDLGIVLEDEACNSSCWFILCLYLQPHDIHSPPPNTLAGDTYLCKYIDQVVVEVRILVQSLQLLRG